MSKFLMFACTVSLGISIAGAAAALNPQPLPPRCVAGAHCGGRTGAHGHMVAMSRHAIHCKMVHHRRICRR